MHYTVYKITNRINSKIYIGVHKTTNLDDGYMGSGTHLKRAQEKYGIENFEKEILAIFDNAEDMFNMETVLVNEEFIMRSDTYNLKVGGEGGFDYINKNISFENRGIGFINKNGLNNIAGQCYITAQRLNDSEYRAWFSNKIKEAVSEYHKKNIGSFSGKKHSDESKKKIGSANSIHQTGESNSQYGTMWIHNLIEKKSIKIPKDDFEKYCSEGWLKGRKMKF